MKFKLIATTFALSWFCIGSPALADGSATAGQAKAATCAACHGMDGNSVNPEWPSLAGQHEQYTAKQLRLFKSGVRQNPVMSPMAQPLSEQDIDDLAAYFASQKPRGLEADKSKVALGQRLYRGGNEKKKIPACLACHGPNGRGNPLASYPSLNGQQAVYIVNQLNAYKAGQRTSDPNKVMRDVAANLSADEIVAVASYVQGLR